MFHQHWLERPKNGTNYQSSATVHINSCLLRQKFHHLGTAISKKVKWCSPEIGLSELLHVKLLVCERGEVNVSNGREHFACKNSRGLR